MLEDAVSGAKGEHSFGTRRGRKGGGGRGREGEWARTGIARVAHEVRQTRERGACSRTCIPQSGIPLLFCRIHIYAASLGDNSAIMRRARARPSAASLFSSLHSPLSPLSLSNSFIYSLLTYY